MTIRPPAVAGLFYPADAAALRHRVEALLAAPGPDAADPDAAAPEAIKALIVPHAGYDYSGPIAASAYRLLSARTHPIRRVVLLGPAHRLWLRGVALADADAFASPLGQVAVDTAALRALAALPQVVTLAAAHQREHALEVQLPFLQVVLGQGFSLVPLLVGEATAAEVAAVLECVWGGDETLIVVSSDLSHDHPYPVCRQLDRATVAEILARRTHLTGEAACGARALNGLMLAARRHGLHPHLLDLRNSGDTAGDHQRVVGYAAFACTAT